LRALENSQLAEEQKEAVGFVCRSRNQVVAVRGIAGAGKTTMLRALDRQLVDAGREMLYLAPTASAVKTLQGEGFEKATTVAAYLTGAPKQPHTGAVIIIDEAGLQSSKQGTDVLALAQKHRQRVVFVGDSRQHVSVDAGDFLRILETHSKLESRELRNIRRQTAEEYRQAVLAMADGQVRLGMEQLNALGWIKEGHSDYLHEAANAWMERSERGNIGADVIAVAPTWEENFALSHEIRLRLKAEGKLGEAVHLDAVHSLKWTTEQKSRLAELVASTPGLMVTPIARMDGLEQSRSYPVEGVEGKFVRLAGGHLLNPTRSAKRFDIGRSRQLEVAPGDQLLIRMNDKAHKLVNGEVLVVESVGADGTLRTECGREIPATFRQFAHGYCVTSHKAQGRTARHVIVAAARLDGKAAYVGCSRGRESCDVFTVNKEDLFAGLPFDGNRRAALDVLKEQRHVARERLARPPSIVNRIKKAAASAVRRVSQLGKRLRNQAEHARRADMLAAAQLPTKQKSKSL
jgi:ATP-dependent exoDNAse (exonuclease V) alpha subunit